MTTGQIVVLILFVLSLVAGTITGAQLYYRMSYLWGILWVGSWIWSKIALRGIQFRRTARTIRAQVGQIFEERFEIDNRNRMPRPLIIVRNESTLPDSQGSRVFPVIEGHRGRSYVARTRLLKRGVYPLGPTLLESGDPFGLFQVSKVIPPSDSLMVYPMMVEVALFPSPPGVLPGGDALRRRTPQVTTNAAGVREYAPGDPLNRIHWVSTARRGRLIAKEFELDPQAEVWIFLDAMRSVQASVTDDLIPEERDDFWSKPVKMPITPTTEEYGVSIAASLARYYLRNGRSVGFVSAGQSLSVLPPERGGRQLGKILEALALLRAEGDLPLRGLVNIQAQHIARGSTLVLITSSSSPEISLTVDFVLRRGLRPVAVLIDAASFNGPSGVDTLEGLLKFMNVPVRRVGRGADLATVLGEGK
jgi:uncharacterized protein (DUF58 family)